jgi:DHA1 family bicyclomycin/chloramphenicol resistance-like MFS transporter
MPPPIPGDQAWTAGGSGARPRYGEFVALVALMTSPVALSIDAMLPALATIGADLGARHPNDAQLILSALFLGLACGQMVYGPCPTASAASLRSTSDSACSWSAVFCPRLRRASR